MENRTIFVYLQLENRTILYFNQQFILDRNQRLQIIQCKMSNYDFLQLENLLYLFIPKSGQKRQKNGIIWL